MRRQTKKILLGLGAGLSMHLLGIFLIGIADDFATTSKGIVDPNDFLDAEKIYLLLQDPTFKRFLSWGSVVIGQTVGVLMLGIVLPVLTCFAVALLSFRDRQ